MPAEEKDLTGCDVVGLMSELETDQMIYFSDLLGILHEDSNQWLIIQKKN